MNRVILLTLFCQHTKKITLLYIFVAGNIIIRNIKWLKLKLSGQHTCLLRKEDLRQNKSASSLLQSIPLSLVLLESSKDSFDLKHKNASYTKCLFQIFYCCSLRQKTKCYKRHMGSHVLYFWSILQLTARIIALSSPFYANCILQRVNL